VKILVYEHITAGGAGKDGGALIDEGAAILRAAMKDFSEFAEPFTLAAPEFLSRLEGVGGVRIMDDEHFSCLSKALDRCHSVLFIAPETGGILYRVTTMAAFRSVPILGSVPSAIETCAGKLKFARRMEELGLPHPKGLQIVRGYNPSLLNSDRWITKPLEGAGCQNARVYGRGAPVLAPLDGNMMIQEYIEGEPMSACVLGWKKGVTVVSINRQYIKEVDGALEYMGGEVTDMEPDAAVIRMAETIWRGIPGLYGYWGIDYVNTPSGPVVIEVNPRLTTSYCALGASIGQNPAQLIHSAALGRPIQAVASRKSVRFSKRGELSF